MKHAVFCATRNLYGDMEAAARSLVANSDVGRVHFLIEDAYFPRPLPDIIECHDVSGQAFFPLYGPNASTSWTWMVLMRAALCHVLPDVDKVLSLDCDAFCVRDASAIWDTDLDGRYLAGVTERGKASPGKQYANFGVVLFDLAKLRDGKADEVIASLNSRHYQYPEQDAFNELCNGRIVELPDEWCAMAFNAEVDNPRIVHFAGVRREKWSENPEAKLYIDMTWDEAMRMHDAKTYQGRPVMFTSDHTLTRAENLRAVWGAYKGPKEFVRGTEHMADAARKGYAAVVCDTLPRYMPNKGDCKSIVIGHAITGDKKYALDETRGGIDKRAFAQIDASVNPSTKTVDIMARQFGIPAERVYPLGMPRTDAIIGKRKGDGETFLRRYGRAYLYTPTYHASDDGAKLPNIDWAKLDAMLEDDEMIVVKRHYFQREPVVKADVDRIAEVVPSEASTPYLLDCDVLFTDFSSITFDALVAGKPTVLLTDHAETYLANRGMYLDYPRQYSSRWTVAEDNEEKLLEMLREAAQNGLCDTERDCLDLVADMCDGRSTERVCELIGNLVGLT